MKIENCHPKIEDRIDLRPCPLILLHYKDWQNLSINLGPVKVRHGHGHGHHNVVSRLDNLHLFLQFIPIFRMLALIVASLDLSYPLISSAQGTHYSVLDASRASLGTI